MEPNRIYRIALKVRVFVHCVKFDENEGLTRLLKSLLIHNLEPMIYFAQYVAWNRRIKNVLSLTSSVGRWS